MRRGELGAAIDVVKWVDEGRSVGAQFEHGPAIRVSLAFGDRSASISPVAGADRLGGASTFGIEPLDLVVGGVATNPNMAAAGACRAAAKTTGYCTTAASKREAAEAKRYRRRVARSGV